MISRFFDGTSNLVAGILCFLWIGCPAVGAERVLLVRGTVSAPDDAERNYARRVAGNVSRWLSEMGVPHDILDDEQVSRGVPVAARTVILPYNPYPAATEVSALRQFTARDGKLIVFFGAEPALASLLHANLGPYAGTNDYSRWRQFRFDGGPPHLPALVRQTSRSIRTVYPVDGRARVIASWEDAAGRPTDDSAWLQSPAGFWMTHVLLDDGDTWNKKRMLVGLVAACDSSVWSNAAAKCLDTAGRISGAAGLEESVQRILAEAKDGAGEAAVQAAVAEARVRHAELTSLMSEGRYSDVVEQSRNLADRLLEARGLVQNPRPGEFRGVWDHKSKGLYPGDWARTCAVLASNNVTDLLVNVLWPGQAHCRSSVVPPSELFRVYGDQLAPCLAAARPIGLKVHVWKVCWRLDGAAPDTVARLRTEGRLQVSDTGQTLNWLCPSHPANLQMEKDAIRDLLRTYDVDGIHLDYVRYPDSHACYCAGCRNRFETSRGKTVGQWPPGRFDLLVRHDYARWRVAQITRLVGDLRVVVKNARPGAKLSAAVFGKYPLCIDSIGQDWGDWLAKGTVDFVCPMNYTTALAQFEDYLNVQLALPSAKGRVFPGLGVTAAESRLDAHGVIDQIRALRNHGAEGFVLFDLNHVLECEILPTLKLGVMARR